MQIRIFVKVIQIIFTYKSLKVVYIELNDIPVSDWLLANQQEMTPIRPQQFKFLAIR